MRSQRPSCELMPMFVAERGSVAMDVMPLVLTAVAGIAIGYLIASNHLLGKVTDAKVDTGVCVSANDSQTAAIATLQAKLQEQTAAAAAQKDIADAAMQARDTLQARLHTQAQARARTINEVGHADPTCADLATVPVCPAVADRLWPAAPTSGGAHAGR